MSKISVCANCKNEKDCWERSPTKEECELFQQEDCSHEWGDPYGSSQHYDWYKCSKCGKETLGRL